jgi:hypothetical protein
MFRDRESGKIVVAQTPNPPLWVFIAAVAIRLVVPTDGALHDVVGWIGRLALGWWAVDELVRGVNPWRRLLGFGGCAHVVISIVALVT